MRIETVTALAAEGFDPGRGEVPVLQSLRKARALRGVDFFETGEGRLLCAASVSPLKSAAAARTDSQRRKREELRFVGFRSLAR
jgi:hypothetical protein